MKKRIVIKIGTSTLTEGTTQLSYGKVEDLAKQIVVLQKDHDVILVSSGAVAAARHEVRVTKQTEVILKQALAAIGQPKLMKMYDEVFESYGLHVAQCLLTYQDFKNETTRENTTNTLTQLLAHGYIPIINENDTVAVEEIIVGDNDKLSAFVAGVIDAELLIIASDIDGLYDKNPHLHPDAQLIEQVHDLESVRHFAQEKESQLGTGGMTSKIHAARICQQNHVDMWIVNGRKQGSILDAMNKQMPFTQFIFS